MMGEATRSTTDLGLVGPQLVQSGRGGWSDLTPHPIRRWIARQFDVSVTLGLVFMAATTPFAFILGDAAALLIGVAAVLYLLGPLRGFLAAVQNAAFLRWTGTTPGKWLCGVRVARADGAALTFGAALKRELDAFGMGCGLYLPLIGLVAMAYNFQRLRKVGATSWDEMRGLLVEQRPNGAVQAVLTLVALLLVAFLVLLVLLAGLAVEDAQPTI